MLELIDDAAPAERKTVLVKLRLVSNHIANIYSYATYDNFIITFDKDITNLINIDDELKIVLDNNNKNNLEIVLDDTT